MRALAQWNDALEQRVAERTALAEQRAEALTLSEAALRDQSRMLRSILDNMGDGVVVAESDGRFRLFNPRGEAGHVANLRAIMADGASHPAVRDAGGADRPEAVQ